MTHPYVEQIAQDIRDLKVQGAIHIAIAAEEALKIVVMESRAKSKEDFIKELKEAGKVLKDTRPTAVALPNAVDKLISKVEESEGNVKELKARARLIAQEMIQKTELSIEKVAENGAPLIKDGMTIFEHCHSSNVIAILRKAKEQGKKFKVICTETRPFGQGYISARELGGLKIDVTLIVDSAAHLYLKEGVDLVLVGADTITKNGDLINKVGTSTIGLLAEKYNTPMYVATQSLKFDHKREKGEDVPIEERDPKEIIDPEDLPGVKIENRVFDVTGAELITGIITEQGILKPTKIGKLKKEKQ